MPSPSKPHPKSASKPPVPASYHDTFQVSPATASTGGGGGGSSQRQHPTATATAASDDDDSLDFVADDQPVTMIGPFEVRQTLAKNADYVTKLGYHAAQRTLHEIRIYSLKRLKGDARLRLRIEREILVMRGINHPYLLRLDDVLYSPSHLYVVTEFCQGGELYDVLASSTMDPTKLLTIPVVARILLQLVTAVAYLHTKGVAHRDVKLEHIFLDGRNTVKVGGLSSAGVSGSVPSPAAAEEHQQQQQHQQQQPETWTVGPSVAAVSVSGRSKAQSADAKATKEFGDLRFTVPFGSQHYAAPEVITCGLVKRDDISDVAPPTYDGRAADVWSCGVVLFALVTGHLPFQGSTDAALFENIRNRVFAPAAVPLIVQQTKSLQDLLYGMLHVDPQQRLTTGDVLRHPFWVSVPGSRSTGMPGVESTSAGASPPRRDDGHHVPQQQQQQSESQSALQPQQQQRTASSGRPGSHPRGVTGYAAVAAIKRDRSAPVVERRVAAGNRGVAWV